MTEIKENYLDEVFSSKKQKSENIVKNAAHYAAKYYRPNGACAFRYLFRRLPILSWIRTYNIKDFLLKDTSAGLTVIFFSSLI